jgi:hypothetical protein
MARAARRDVVPSKPGRVPGLSFSGAPPADAARVQPGFRTDCRAAPHMPAIRAGEVRRPARA